MSETFVKSVSIDLGDSVEKSIGGEDLYWTVVTAEIKDIDGDIIRVDGIDLTEGHLPPDKKMPLLVGHQKQTADGFPLVIGQFEQFKTSTVKYKGKDVKALLGGYTYAKDGKGNYTKLASAYKDLRDGGYLKSVSPSFRTKAKPKSLAGGRYDIENCSIYEVSSTPIPANVLANATLRKSLEDAGAIPKDDTKEPEQKLATADFVESFISKAITELKVDIEKAIAQTRPNEDQMNQIEGLLNRLFLDHTKSLESRLDALEISFVAKAHTGTTPSNPEGANLNPKDMAERIKQRLFSK